MSSIAGRFLYQFGLTAAVAVLVSLLVSFTLTPMMSARLLRVKRDGHDEESPAKPAEKEQRGKGAEERFIARLQYPLCSFPPFPLCHSRTPFAQRLLRAH